MSPLFKNLSTYAINGHYGAVMNKTVFAFLTVLLFSLTADADATAIISADQAFAAAEKTAQGKLVEIKLSTKKNRLTYEIEIFDGKNGINKIKVDALNASIVETQWESVRAEKAAAFSKAEIKYKTALETALKNMPGGKVKELELKSHGGTPVYKIEILDTNGIEHDILINATDGNVIAIRPDTIIINKPRISLEQAEKTALSRMDGTVLYTELEEDDEKLHYQVLIFSQNSIYEIKVDAVTGNILRTKKK